MVALEDACVVDPDFLLLRTTTSSLGTLFRQYDFNQVESSWPQLLHWFTQSRDVLLVRTTNPANREGHCQLKALDANMQTRLIITAASSSSYREVCGEEYLIGLQLIPQQRENDGSSCSDVEFDLQPRIARE